LLKNVEEFFLQIKIPPDAAGNMIMDADMPIYTPAKCLPDNSYFAF